MISDHYGHVGEQCGRMHESVTDLCPILALMQVCDFDFWGVVVICWWPGLDKRSKGGFGLKYCCSHVLCDELVIRCAYNCQPNSEEIIVDGKVSVSYEPDHLHVTSWFINFSQQCIVGMFSNNCYLHALLQCLDDDTHISWPTHRNCN